ncbi:hypothetical protein Pla163_10180 [Planctomycetes bacterium Pla163]|uniref:Uncharacterized protein n=1 Tax=Rohdeia mirabilis TaxID=2528008 RepID=A0A518CXI7_9BACT|nr:hypothetical protein Pla163_10180 [Planctomycetes bacterium Pla163]
MNDPQAAVADAGVAHDHVPFTPRQVLGALFVAGGAAALVLASGVLEPSRRLLVWPLAAGLLGVLQVRFGDRLLARTIGLCLAAAGALAIVGALTTDLGRAPDALVVVGALGSMALGVNVLARTARMREVEHPGQVRLLHILSGGEIRFGAQRFGGGDATSVLGAVDLDLRDAHIAPGETVVLDVLAVLGGVDLRVPPDWEVDNRVLAIVGAVDVAATAPSGGAGGGRSGARPRLRIEGLVVLGGLEVKRS